MRVEVARTEDLEACLRLRRTVFVEEQGVPEALERDEHDATALHLLATAEGRPVGTARLLVKGGAGKIGRVCVLPEARGLGIGAALIWAAVEEVRGLGLASARLSSQVSALGFYERLGFVAEGEVYDDAGIPHRDMALAL